MSAVFPTDGDAIELTSPTAVPLEGVRVSTRGIPSIASARNGSSLRSALDDRYGRFRHSCSDIGPKQVCLSAARIGPRSNNHLRFSGDWLQETIDEWWNSYTDWKPILQIFSGLRYQPGYVDADVILSSAAIESLATRLQQHESPRLTADEQQPFLDALDSLTDLNSTQKEILGNLKREVLRTTFRSKVEQLVESVPVTVWKRPKYQSRTGRRRSFVYATPSPTRRKMRSGMTISYCEA